MRTLKMFSLINLGLKENYTKSLNCMQHTDKWTQSGSSITVSLVSKWNSDFDLLLLFSLIDVLLVITWSSEFF